MTDYNVYIKSLKDHQISIDYDQMYGKIKKKAGQGSYVPKLALAGALAMAVFAIGLYLGAGPTATVATKTVDEPVMEYVFEDSSEVNGPVMTYVLYEY